MDHAQGRRRRSAVAVLLAGLLVTVGACKSSGDSKPTGAGSSGASGASSAATQVTNDPRAPGVTADTVKVGVTYPDLSSLKDVLQIDNGDFEKAFNAVADDINGKGGINGRKLQLVFAMRRSRPSFWPMPPR